MIEKEEIKCRNKAGNSCYYSVQTLLSSRLLSKNLKIKIYKTIILTVVLTWSLRLRDESRLRVFENRILRLIHKPKRDDNGEWRRLHNEERSPNIVRVIKSRSLRWAGHVARMEESGNAFNILSGTPTGKRSLGRPRLRWEDNITMDLK